MYPLQVVFTITDDVVEKLAVLIHACPYNFDYKGEFTDWKHVAKKGLPAVIPAPGPQSSDENCCASVYESTSLANCSSTKNINAGDALTPAEPPFNLGDRVQVEFDGKHYPATIYSFQMDGTPNVVYDETKESEFRVDWSRIFSSATAVDTLAIEAEQGNTQAAFVGDLYSLSNTELMELAGTQTKLRKADLIRIIEEGNTAIQKDEKASTEENGPTSGSQDLSDLDLNSIKGVVENDDGR